MGSFPYTELMGNQLAQVNIKDAFAPAKNFSTIGDLVTVIVQNAFVLAGIIAFVLVILAGFGIISSAGSGDTKQMEQGKKALTGAVMGLIIIIASFWIVQIIEALTGQKFLPLK
jgi:hypothetical protein